MLMQKKVAMVTGVGPGLGRATALALAREGADIVVAARTRPVLESVAREVEALGRKALVVPTDVGNEEQARRLPEAAFERFRRIDVLVNNAGWSGPYELITDMSLDAWDQIVNVNLKGTMMVCKFTAPYMVRAKGGVIVNTTSLSMRKGNARRGAYSAAKAGITLMTQTLADELGPHGIRANCVAPGHMWSDKLKTFYEMRATMLNKPYEEVLASYVEAMALRRNPRVEEVANAVLFLASDMASAITGQSLDVNCGHFFH